MTLPTQKDINPTDGNLDELSACEHFLGKNLDEAEALFRENDFYYQEDLMWMGAPAFNFYFPAAVRYIQNGTDVSSFVEHIASTLKFRLECKANELAASAAQLAEFCGYVIEHWPRLREGTSNDGEVFARYEELREAFLRLASQNSDG